MLKEIEITESNSALIFDYSKHQPVLGTKLEVHWRMALANSLMPFRFFMLDGAILELTKTRAMLLGNAKNWSEAQNFLRFCGVEGLVCTALPKGWCCKESYDILLRQPNALLQNADTDNLHMQQNNVQHKAQRIHDVTAVAQLLSIGDDFEQSPAMLESFCAETCAKRNHGLAALYGIYNASILASTAGIYDLGEHEGYIACVETACSHKKKGMASALMRQICSDYPALRLSLTCSTDLFSFYSRFGFVPNGQKWILASAT